MRQRRAFAVGAAAAALLACPAVAGADAPAGAGAPADAVRLSSAFDRGAQLGESTALHVALELDPDLATSPLTAISVRYPASLGLATSGLGLATCHRPASDFENVIIGGIGLAGCPRNAVIARGRAVGEVRLGSMRIPEHAGITVLAGPIKDARMGVVAYVDGYRPFGVKLAYAGEIHSGPASGGENLSIRFPRVPGIPDDATVALVRVRLSIGSHTITYRDRRGRRYRPHGIVLPDRCPAGGFRFRAQLGFEDRSRMTATATVPCPRGLR